MRLCLVFFILCFVLPVFSATLRPFAQWSEEEKRECVDFVFLSIDALMDYESIVAEDEAREVPFAEDEQVSLVLSGFEFSPNKLWSGHVNGSFFMVGQLVSEDGNQKGVFVERYVGNFYGLQAADLSGVVDYWKNQNPYQHILAQDFEIKVS